MSLETLPRSPRPSKARPIAGSPPVRRSCFICVKREREVSADKAGIYCKVVRRALWRLAHLGLTWLDTVDGFDWYRLGFPSGGKIADVVSLLDSLGLPVACGPFYPGHNGSYSGRELHATGSSEVSPGKRGSVARALLRCQERMGFPGELIYVLTGNATTDLADYIPAETRIAPSSWDRSEDSWDKIKKRWPMFPALWQWAMIAWQRGEVGYTLARDGKLDYLERWLDCQLGPRVSFSGAKKRQNWHGLVSGDGVHEEREINRQYQTESLPHVAYDPHHEWNVICSVIATEYAIERLELEEWNY